MRDMSCVQNRLPLRQSAISVTMMDVSRRQERERTVSMLIIIPLEKGAAEDPRLGKIGKRCWKLRLILGRFEKRFDVRVIVGDVRSRMALGHAQIRQHEGDGLRGHRAAAEIFSTPETT